MALKKTSAKTNVVQPKTDVVKAEDPIKDIPIPSPTLPSMVNTIALSTDMNTIYLIEAGRVIPYSLYSIGGVLIGLIGNQLTVVSAIEPMPDSGTKTESARAAVIPVVKSLKVSVDKGQWTILFLPKFNRISIMGATDIDSSIRENTDQQLEGYLFDLREGYVNIRRSGNSLIAVSVSMKA
ncbi:MAG: hypothetical protein IPJ74_02755 [Saprospiraceae bacterium]|nr:hypothetical protein [Saprospiraceae bacterium]